jgi:hypothetical protein
VVAGGGRHIRIYDAAGPSFRLLRDVGARDVGWSILDTDISPDRRHLLYSSWSDFSAPPSHLPSPLASGVGAMLTRASCYT